MRTAVFLSVRQKATRLPGKVLKEIHGRTITEHLIDRLRSARLPDHVVMTTSTHPDDGILARIAERCGIPAFRGSPDDKLDRYQKAARHFGIDFMVVADGDNVFCDPETIDRIVDVHRTTGADYVTVDDLPLGATSLGLRARALDRLMAIKDESDTEVWGPYFRNTGLFRAEILAAPEDLRRPDIRLTLDYPEDLELIRAVFDRLHRPGRIFSLREIVDLFRREPALREINRGRQEEWRRHQRKSAGVRLRPDYREILANMGD
jgi:spore coat polysaccharide biosynthesis protein SpsF